MKTLNFNQMEKIEGGLSAAAQHNACVGSSVGGAIITGVGFLMAACAGPIGWGALALAYAGIGVSALGYASC